MPGCRQGGMKDREEKKGEQWEGKVTHHRKGNRRTRKEYVIG